MKGFFNLLKTGLQASQGRMVLSNYLPQRGVRYKESITSVKLEKKSPCDPAVTGDLVPFPQIDFDSPYVLYKNSKELETADEKVKKLFSVRYHSSVALLENYKKQLVDRVKLHDYDDQSPEIKIAILTAKIRYWQAKMANSPKKLGHIKNLAVLASQQRKKKLRLLRMADYLKFEWLLEKLDLEYRPPVGQFECKVTRKRSLMRLAKLKVEQDKEEKLAALKKAYNEQKIPFLEKKIAKLKEIKQMEEENDLPPTVSEEDINEVLKKLETVKVELAEWAERGYKRKIHPFFLEPYEEQFLWKKEKAGELIREKLIVENQNEFTENAKSNF